MDLAPIARGGVGDVRRVYDTEFSRIMAMKITRRSIIPEFRTHARFENEIEIMASLRHPGILPSYDHGEFEDGRLGFTMPEIQGRTLADVLDELHSIDGRIRYQSSVFRRALESFAQICEIIAFAHKQGVVHRDLKPKNMMVAEDGQCFVIDWGIAKRIDPTAPHGPTNMNSRGRRALTETGDVLGTPAYMPPEQARGDISLQSSASDVYSLGAVLYFLLAGEPPYRGTRPAVLVQIKRGPPRPISMVTDANSVPPRELVELCEAAMHRDTAKRISGAGQIVQEIRSWLEGFSSTHS